MAGNGVRRSFAGESSSAWNSMLNALEDRGEVRGLTLGLARRLLGPRRARDGGVRRRSFGGVARRRKAAELRTKGFQGGGDPIRTPSRGWFGTGRPQSTRRRCGESARRCARRGSCSGAQTEGTTGGGAPYRCRAPDCEVREKGSCWRGRKLGHGGSACRRERKHAKGEKERGLMA
jgi:hypothetical protein